MAERKVRAGLALVVGIGLTFALMGASADAHSQATGQSVAQAKKKWSNRPNVVLILMDDFSTELLKTMPNTLRLKKKSAYYPNSFVADSLCCTSRSSLLTGMYPHNTGVRTNTRGKAKLPVGGYRAFKRYKNPVKTVNHRLNNKKNKRPYRTGFMGKYLNQYGKYLKQVKKRGKMRRPEPGWTIWNPILGGGYQNWGYKMGLTERGVRDKRYMKLRHYGKKPKDYATTVLQKRATWFIKQYQPKPRPYFLEVSTYATHSRVGGKAHPNDPLFPPAFRDRPSKKNPGGNCGAVSCGSLNTKDLRGFNDPTGDNRPRFFHGRKARRWQENDKLGRGETKTAVKRLRDRARMAQAVDRLVGRVQKATGPNTYIIVTSDNGFHLGQHRSKLGKGTAYDHDIRVPLIVRGPVDRKGRPTRVAPGRRNTVVSNVDLAATIERLAGKKPAAHRNGRSFHRSLFHRSVQGSKFAFVEHTKPGTFRGKPGGRDPDDDSRLGGNTGVVPSYIAVRTTNALLVRYDMDDRPGHKRYAYEYYPNIAKHGYERTNRYAKSRNSWHVKMLRQKIRKFDGCTPRQCRKIRG